MPRLLRYLLCGPPGSRWAPVWTVLQSLDLACLPWAAPSTACGGVPLGSPWDTLRDWLPLLRPLKVTARFGVVVAPNCAVFAGFALREVLTRVTARAGGRGAVAAALVVLALLLCEYAVALRCGRGRATAGPAPRAAVGG